MFSRLQTEQSVALSVYTLSIYCNHRLLRVKRGLVYIVILWSPTFQKFGCDIVTPVLSVYSSVYYCFDSVCMWVQLKMVSQGK